MTLQELKDKRIFSSYIKDNDLIKLFNDVLKINPEIKNMNYNVNDNSIYSVLFSKLYVDLLVQKIMSQGNISHSLKCEMVINNLNKIVNEAKKHKKFDKEIFYMNSIIEEMKKKKVTFSQIESFSFDNIDSLVGLQLDTKLDSLVNEDKTASIENKIEEELKVDSNKTVVHQDINSGMDELQVESGKVITPVSSRIVKTNVMPSLYPENSVRYLRNHDKILLSIPEDELISYCNDVLKFNPKLVDYKSQLTQGQIKLLNNSNLVFNASVKYNISKSHEDIINGYTTLISNYEKILSNLPETKEFDDERKKIVEALDALMTQKSSYKGVVRHFDTQNIEQYFNFGVSNNFNVSKGVSQVSNLVTDSQQTLLTELDSEIAMLAKEKEKSDSFEAKNGSGKIVKVIDSRLINIRLHHLRKKQGRIQNQQSKIIDANTILYTSRMNREFEKYRKQQYFLERSLGKKEIQINKEKSKEKRLAELKLKIKSVQKEQKVTFGVDRAGLKAEELQYKAQQKQLEASLKRLKSKSGKVNIVEQYSSTLNSKMSYAL